MNATRPCRVLIADDDPDLIQLLRWHLENEGYLVQVARDGESALGLIRNAAPDVLILDLVMPKLDGLEVLKRLRSQPETASLPIIVLSAKDEPDDVFLGWQSGASVYLTKPVNPRELLRHLVVLQGSTDEVSTQLRDGGAEAGPLIALTAGTMRDLNCDVAKALRAQEYRVVVHPNAVPPNRGEQRLLLEEAVGVIAGSEPFTHEVMDEAKKLRVISRNGIGYDAIDLQAATELGIVVCYTPDVMAETVADHTFALLLAAARRITDLDAATKRGEWQRIIGSDVNGQTLGLIGTGRIGTAVARRARAFGMKLIGHDPFPNPVFERELGGEYLSLEEVLSQSDFVSLHLPSTPETRGMVTAERIGMMKPSAFLVNTARGALIDEAALLTALHEGKLAGAGLDVLSAEPPLPGSPATELARHPRVVITPHVASYTPITAARMGQAALENMLAVLRGTRPDHVANPQVYEAGLRE
jgi:phosphoglycerate dehydrogenase-like enzyme/ActR/RegA family two-component response regulator